MQSMKYGALLLPNTLLPSTNYEYNIVVLVNTIQLKFFKLV